LSVRKGKEREDRGQTGRKGKDKMVRKGTREGTGRGRNGGTGKEGDKIISRMIV